MTIIALFSEANIHYTRENNNISFRYLHISKCLLFVFNIIIPTIYVPHRVTYIVLISSFGQYIIRILCIDNRYRRLDFVYPYTFDERIHPHYNTHEIITKCQNNFWNLKSKITEHTIGTRHLRGAKYSFLEDMILGIIKHYAQN